MILSLGGLDPPNRVKTLILMDIIKPNSTPKLSFLIQALARLEARPLKELPASPKTGASLPLLA